MKVIQAEIERWANMFQRRRAASQEGTQAVFYRS
jgi:hypothetical protein